MADHFYGVAVGHGADSSAVTFGTSTGSTAIELRVTDGVTGMNKKELLKALATIKDYIVEADAPA